MGSEYNILNILWFRFKYTLAVEQLMFRCNSVELSVSKKHPIDLLVHVELTNPNLVL